MRGGLFRSMRSPYRPAQNGMIAVPTERDFYGGWIMAGNYYMEARGIPNQLYFSRDGHGSYCGVTAGYIILPDGKLMISSLFGTFQYDFSFTNEGKRLTLRLGNDTILMDHVED